MNLKKLKADIWLPHIIGLLFFSILPFFVFESTDSRSVFWKNTYYHQLVFMIIAFYVNYLVLVPGYFFSKKKVYFVVIVFAFAILVLLVMQLSYDVLGIDEMRKIHFPQNRQQPRPPGFLGLHPKMIDNFFLIILVLGFSTGMAIMHRMKKNENEQKEIEKARLDSELAFLKNQISPHFFFNSLNNIYALIAIDSNKAQKAVEKLSGLMRYLIYDSDIKEVQLKKEFEFNRNYIELMRQRISTKIDLKVDISQEVPLINIPPLIFIPFIENAFKHGISYRNQSYILITLKIVDQNIVFHCRNSVPEKTTADYHTQGGMGIPNIKKRLALLYGDKAKLTMGYQESDFVVDLTLPLTTES